MNKSHTNFASSYKSMCQMCFQCTMLVHETYELCTISIIKSWDVKFVNFFWHALSKVWQYAATNEKNYKGVKYVFINVIQRDL